MNSKPREMNPSRGLTAIRAIKSLGVARGDPVGALAFAQSQNWSNTYQVCDSIKAIVEGSSTSNIQLQTPAEHDFSMFVRPLTILGKLTGLRHVPDRTRLISQTAGSTAYWSGETSPRPISKLDFNGSTIEPLSVVAMVVSTMELLRSSSPSAESILSRDLAAAAAQALDEAFIDPTNAGSAGVKPASITNGVSPVHSAGSSLAQIDSDLGILIQALSDAGSDLSFATFIMRPRTALYLAGLRGSGGALAHPGMSVQGGTLLGLPAIVSTASPSSIGSPAEGGNITLLDPSQILVVDDGGSALAISEQASIQMETAPGSGAQSQVSLWQTNSAVLKVSRYLNWQPCRAGMAQVLDAVAY